MIETFLEINLNTLMNNLKLIEDEMNKQYIMAIVKGDAYGHGIVEISKQLENKVEYLGVGLEYEAIKLRENDIKKPILILSPYFDPNNILEYNITPTIDNIEDLYILSNIAKENDKKINFHLKINTGMNRFGIKPNDIENFIDKYLIQENLNLEGVFSHFAISIDRDSKFVNKQLEIFNNSVEKLLNNNIEIKYIHMANSTAAFEIPNARFNMVRMGNALYGKVSKRGSGIKNIAKLKSKIIDIRNISKGEYVGYGLGYKANKDIRVGIIPVGFSDGFEVVRESKSYSVKDMFTNIIKVLYRYKKPRKLVYYNNTSLDTIGKTNMQFILVDLTGKENISKNDLVDIMVPSFFISNDIPKVYKLIDKQE